MTFMFIVIAVLDTAIYEGDLRNALRLSEDDFKRVCAARG